MKGSLLLYSLKLNCLIFSTGLNSSLIIFIWTYTVNSKCIGQTLCSYEHYLVCNIVKAVACCDALFESRFSCTANQTVVMKILLLIHKTACL